MKERKFFIGFVSDVAGFLKPKPLLTCFAGFSCKVRRDRPPLSFCIEFPLGFKYVLENKMGKVVVC